MYQPKSLHEIRVYHSKLIISALRQYGSMTKNDLALRTGLSLSSVTNILKILTKKNIVKLGDKIDSFAGRPATYIDPVLDVAWAIGIDVTYYHVRYALMNLGNPVLEKEKYTVEFENTDEYWDNVKLRLEAFIDKCGIDREKLAGVMLSTRLTCDSDKCSGKVVAMLHYNPVELDIDAIRSRFSEYNFDVTLNTKIAGLLYAWENTEMSDYVYLTVGTTIGGCLVRDYEVIDPLNLSGNFGHMVIRADGAKCGCGRQGCFELLCSVGVLYHKAYMESEVEFFEEYENGNPRCAELWNEYLDNFAVALDNLFMVYDLDIVIGGTIAPYLEKYQDDLYKRLHAEGRLFNTDHKLVFSPSSEYCSAMGAAVCVISRFISNEIS